MFSPDESKRYHIISYDPWNGVQVEYTYNILEFARATYDHLYNDHSMEVVLWDSVEKRALAKSTPGQLVFSTATW